jgi:hypothetical protein
MLEEGDEVAQRTGRQTAGGGRRARGGRQVEEAGVQDVVVWVGALTFSMQFACAAHPRRGAGGDGAGC